MKQFLLLLKGKKELDYSPKELQKRIDEFLQWASTIEEYYVADNRLERSGVHMKNENEVLTDGPFLEAKEIIAGYIILKGESIEQITDVAKTSPLLQYFEIFIRPMVDSKPT